MASKIEIRVTDMLKGKEILKTALEDKLSVVELGILRTRKQLQFFEKKYGTNSDLFYKKFNAGELNERDDFIDWAGEFEILLELEKEKN